MFTEGLDEKAINWIKQGSDADPQPRSPLIEKYPLDSVSNQPLMYKSNNFLSPIVLPPVKFHSGLLGPRPNLCDSEDDESVASVPEDSYINYSDTFEEDGLASSDSDLFEKPKNQSYEDEIDSGVVLSHEPTRGLDRTLQRTLLRGLTKENLRVEVERHVTYTHGARGIADRSSISGDIMHNHEQDGFPSSHDYPFKESMVQRFQEVGTPSAPPIGGNGGRESNIDVEVGTKLNFGSTEVPPDMGTKSQKVDEVPARSIAGEGDVQMPSWQTNLAAQIPSYTTRNCMEAPEFLRDECMALRNAFGLQKYLLQPHGLIQEEVRHVDNKEVTCTMKGRKVIGQIEVEGHINSLKATSFPVAPEEVLSCLLQLKSSSEDALAGSNSQVCLKPGTGDSHVFYPESQGDALLVEVQDINTVKQGHAIIQMSSLIDSHGEIIRWWPLYQDDHGCIGNVQLSICISGPSDKISYAKGGPVVETVIYDLVLEAATRAQHLHPKNLHINGAWRWLLNEFADYYGVSEAYTKLRYLSYIMNIATPTKDCLELIYELLLPIIRARDEKILTRQERSILLDCEEQIKMLLATTFENYKSLDDLSPTGLTDMFDPILESAAPALIPAVQIFTLLHDILSHEAQNILRNYLQTAAAKRCRRHMADTDEFMSGNSDGLYTDSVTISTAYLKMKTLCINISNEIQADIKIHNQHILPSSIDLPNIAASLYSIELCKRLRGFLSACPPAKPSLHVTELLIAAADFERNLDSWNIRPVHGGVVSKDLFHNYIMVWIQDARLHLLELCKAEKVAFSGILTICSTSPFVETMYDQIKESLLEYQVVINRWPQYLLSLEGVVADIERAIMKTLEKQYNDVLMPLKDGIPKILEKQVQKLTRRHSTAVYLVPSQLGTFLCTMKRILDVLHCRVEDVLKSWALFLRPGDGNPIFGEQMNGITVMLRKKYKKYMQAIVEKLVSNAQATRNTRLKKILEETKEAEGEAEIRERMQALCLQITDSIHNLHDVFSSRIFVAICRGFWDRMGQIVLSFLESRKENKVWYRGSDYALGIIDDIFASEMQKLQGNSLQDKDLDPPRSVVEARSILC
ncbi:hypothetical protein COCNU_01G006740 [Cocos nucifera]|uniref:Uncharacterized protein n=1 Tax=Cocos nucifera TaxID=13894 RepID=A0A8K0MUS6_COCNU|nr:hypothetical protein COCNU_01G006740 [Cocos nucifera]